MRKYIGITRPLNIVSGESSNIDVKYGPHDKIEDAINDIPKELRGLGLTVGIKYPSGIKEYWWKTGIEDADLILKLDKAAITKTSELENDASFQTKNEVEDSIKIEETRAIAAEGDLRKNKADITYVDNKHIKFKGYYTTLDSLKASYPKADNDKDFFAWVGDTYPGIVYKVNSGGGDWETTNKPANQNEIDLKEYVKSRDFIRAKSQISYRTAFPLSAATNTAEKHDIYWHNDYWAKEVKGIRIKAREGVLRVFKSNIKTKEKKELLTRTFDSTEDAKIIDIIFDNIVTLAPNERIGINGNVYFKLNELDTLFPHVYTIVPTGPLQYQKDITLAYDLITTDDDDRIQFLSDSIEDVLVKLESDASSADSIVVSKEVMNISTTYGTAGRGITTSNLLRVPTTGYITEISVNIDKNVDVYVDLVSIHNNKAYIKNRITFNEPIAGIHTKKVNFFAEEGDYVGYSGGSSKFTYKVNNSTIPNSRFLQWSYGSGTHTANIEGWTGISYIIKKDVDLTLNILKNGYASGTFKEGTLGFKKEYKSILDNTWLTFCANNFVYEGSATKLYIDIKEKAPITIGVGIIDQRGWAIIDSQKIFNPANDGYNEIDINIPITKGQRLFIKTPAEIATCNNGYHMITNSNGIILEYVQDELLFSYDIVGKKYINSGFPSTSDIEAINKDLSNINIKLDSINLNTLYGRSPDGSYWNIIINNDGTIGTKKVNSKNIVIFGNSFERHPITSYWWGDWGMAASTREKDWCHRLESKLKDNNILAKVNVKNIANWETNASTFDYNSINDTLKSDTDIVLFRIGENNPNSATLKEDTIDLINHVRNKLPGVPIIFGGVFWSNPTKQAKLKAAVDSFTDIPFIDFQDLDKAENKSKVGALVYGDDNKWHTVSNSGVANHAGDIGSDKMADRFKPYVIDKLNK